MHIDSILNYLYINKDKIKLINIYIKEENKSFFSDTSLNDFYLNILLKYINKNLDKIVYLYISYCNDMKLLEFYSGLKLNNIVYIIIDENGTIETSEIKDDNIMLLLELYKNNVTINLSNTKYKKKYQDIKFINKIYVR